jgi:hypothetical protein
VRIRPLIEALAPSSDRVEEPRVLYVTSGTRVPLPFPACVKNWWKGKGRVAHTEEADRHLTAATDLRTRIPPNPGLIWCAALGKWT